MKYTDRVREVVRLGLFLLAPLENMSLPSQPVVTCDRSKGQQKRQVNLQTVKQRSTLFVGLKKKHNKILNLQQEEIERGGRGVICQHKESSRGCHDEDLR